MSTPSSSPASSGSATGSLATVVKAVPGARATRRSMSRWMTPHAWRTWRCCPTSRRQPQSASWPVQWAGSASRGSPAAVSFQITARPTARANGARPAVPWISSPSAPGPTHPGRTARLSDSSRPCWPSWRMPCRSRPQRSGTAGCRVIWRSMTATGVTCPWLAAPPFSNLAVFGAYPITQLEAA